MAKAAKAIQPIYSLEAEQSVLRAISDNFSGPFGSLCVNRARAFSLVRLNTAQGRVTDTRINDRSTGKVIGKDQPGDQVAT